MAINPNNLNPVGGLGGFNIGLGTVANALILVVILFLIFAFVVGGIVFFLWNRKYKYKIHVFSKVGNVITKIGTFKAKEIPLGMEKLWFVRGAKRYLSPATLQSAKNEFWFYKRSDGEWINFQLEDIDLAMKRVGTKFIHQDMRLQRLATDQLLEQRLMKKDFWDKYGNLISGVVFFLIIAIALAIIFWQWGVVVDKLGNTLTIVNQLLEKADKLGNPVGNEGLVPAFSLLWFFKRRKTNGNR